MVRPSITADDGIAVVVLTHNRADLLKKCVENVLLRTSPATREIVIWDNGSTDDTQAYLATVTDPRVRVIRSETNVGHNGYARAFRETVSPYMVELDDDVVDAPAQWDLTLLEAFKQLPEVGFLAADIENDPHDEAAHWRYNIHAHEYTPLVHNGINLLIGPTGGGCAMTSREANRQAGGFIEREGEVFWLEDGTYIAALQKAGYGAAVLADLVVHHTGGSYYTTSSKEKEEFWRRHWARKARRDAAKKVLVRIPFVRRLNSRFGWFVAP